MKPKHSRVKLHHVGLLTLAIAHSANAAVTYIDLQGTGSANGTTANAAAPYVLWSTGIANGVDVTSDFSFGIGGGVTITFNVAAHNAGGNDLRFFTANDLPNANNIDGPAHPVIKETIVLRNGAPLDFTISGLAANQQLTMYVVQGMKPNQTSTGPGANWVLNGGAPVSSVAVTQANFGTFAGSFTDLSLFTNIGTATGGGDITGSVTRPNNTFNHVLGGLAFDVVTIPEPTSGGLLGVAGLLLCRRKRSKS